MVLPGVLVLEEEVVEFLQACCGVSGRVWVRLCSRLTTSMLSTWLLLLLLPATS
jgi:hypothetical protein